LFQTDNEDSFCGIKQTRTETDYSFSYNVEVRIRNVTIREQIGLEETIMKEIEQNQLTWCGHVQRMAEGTLPKIAPKWMPKQKTA
jgi:hypothetical protein